MADMNDRLEGLGDFDVNDRTPVNELRDRARARRRRQLGVVGLACAVILGVGVLTFEGRDSANDLAMTGDNGVPDPVTAEDIVVPSFIGRTVADAMSVSGTAGFRASVFERDADLGGAIVIAQEPPPGVIVPTGSVIGLRTALPDTTEAQECPGTSHPHSEPGRADALPLLEQVQRSAVEAARFPVSASAEENLVLGMWNRYAYEVDDDGEPVIKPVEGFQLMALYETLDDCPDAPPTFIGAPLTRVVLELTDFGEGPGSELASGGQDAVWSSIPEPPIDVRSTMAVVWTGTEVVVVGGVDIREGVGPNGIADGTTVDEGGAQTPIHEARSPGAAAFNPRTGQWRRLPELPFLPTIVEASTWTGSEMLMLVHEEVDSEINGGMTETRVLSLDPQADKWQVNDAPDEADSAHGQLASAFTGTEWLLWGYPYHEPDSEPLAIAYDPSTHTWQDIDPGPLSFRELPGSVWTGDEFIVFGGDSQDSYDVTNPPPGDGAAYDPDTDTWRELPPSPATKLRGPTLQWTGSEVLVWGGSFGPSNPIQGAAYNPSSDRWRALAPPPIYGRTSAIVVWSGDRLVVADGTPTYSSTQDGASSATYDPTTDTWVVAPDPPGGPACRSAGVATPFGVYVFGGSIGCTAITPPRDAPLRLRPPT